MSHVIVETPSFDLNIVVPDGTDSRVDAAEKVQALTQKLANRTQSLLANASNAALRNAPNTFTAANAFTAGVTANTVTVSGVLNANGGIHAADGTLEVTSTVVASGAVRVAGQLRADGGIAALDGEIEVASELHCNASVYVNSPHLFLAEAVDIVHPTFSGAVQPQRLVQVDISRACVVEGDMLYNHAVGFWGNTFSGGLGRLEIPIIIPRETEQWSFQVIWAADAVGELNVAEVYRWDRDYSVATVQTPSAGTVLGTLNQLSFDATLGNAFAQSGPVITETNDPTASRYAVVVTFGDGTNNRLYGLRLQFWDPGPRNG